MELSVKPHEIRTAKYPVPTPMALIGKMLHILLIIQELTSYEHIHSIAISPPAYTQDCMPL